MWANFERMNKLPEFFDSLKRLLIDICDTIVFVY